MIAETLIRQAQTDGVKLALSQSGTIKATGHGDAVTRWLPLIREYKQVIVAALESPRVTTAPLGSHDVTPAVASIAETYHGLSLTELKAVAEDDWPDIEHDTVMLDTLAHSIVTRRLREHGIVPPHYTQAVHCEGCGPIWLWEASPGRVQACPWCFVRVQGVTPPRAHVLDLKAL